MRVSAIITTFNRAAYLKKAAQSVLAQTFRDFELIILDNASNDGTEAVIGALSDPRIRSIRHAPLGISEARNLGVREAHGEFIAFLDDDDEWLPEKLARELAVFEKGTPRLGLVYGGFLRITPEGNVYARHDPVLRGHVLEAYLCGRDALTGSASNPLMRKSAVESVGGFDEALKTSEDWELYLRLARAYEFDYTPEPVVKIRAHRGARLGDRLRDALAAEEKVLRDFGDMLAKNPRGRSFYLRAIGGKYCRLGEMERGKAMLRRAITASPQNVIGYLQYAASLLGPKTYAALHRWYKK